MKPVSTIVTPWGAAQHHEQIAPGIDLFSTASHGGMRISLEREIEMAATAPDVFGIAPFCERFWYEEDQDVALICLAFPQYFSITQFHFAYSTAESAWPQLCTPVRKMVNDKWLAENGAKYTQGGGGSAPGGCWTQRAYCVSDHTKTLEKVFTGIPVLPSVFTAEEFENATIYKG